jgi:hypothetical protein
MNTSFENVTQTYSGKPGCMCGCNGIYKDIKSSPKAVKSQYTRIMNNPDVVLDEEVPCAYVETPTRNNVVYFNKG